MSATIPAQEMASCPFCGDRLRITNHTRKNDTKFWRLFCDGETDCFFMDFATEEEAIEMANRRPARDARAAVIEGPARYVAKGREVIDLLTDEVMGEWTSPMLAIYCAESMTRADRRALANRSALSR